MHTTELDRATPAGADREPTSFPRRARVEAGVLLLAIGAVLAFAAGFAALFPEPTVEPAIWTTWNDPAGSFSFRVPPGWKVGPTPRGATARQPGNGMSVSINRLVVANTDVDDLVQRRIAEVDDLGDAEPIDGSSWAVDDLPTAGLRELTDGGGRTTVQLFVGIGTAAYLSIAATATPAAFDEATLDDIVETIRITPEIA